jgi:exopolysaccharide biosynthesis polyprenyl glycosylphosphotransferase
MNDRAAELRRPDLRPASDAVLARARRGERRRPLTRSLATADAVGVAVASTAAAEIAAATSASAQTAALAVYAVCLVPAWCALAALRGVYRHGERRADGPVTDALLPVFDVAAVAAWLTFIPFAAVDAWHVPIVAPFVFWGLAPPLVLLAHLFVRRVMTAHTTLAQRTVIVGAGEVGELVAQKIAAHPESVLQVIGFVDANPRRRVPVDGDGDLVLPVLGAPEDLEELVDTHDVDRVIIAFSLDRHERQLAVVRRLAEKGVAVDLVPRLFEVIGSGVNVWSIEGLPLFGLPPLRLSRGSLVVKRAFDIVASAILLFLLLPVLVLIAVCIRWESRGPALFRQERIGENSRPFTIYKFRSMHTAADDIKSQVAHMNRYAYRGDPRMFKVENDPRVTRFGRYIRRYFFDELPQLFNVFKGDMSLVGPRPLIPEEDQHVVDWQRSRLTLKPGITGPWQVLGGNDIPFDEMVKLDYLYVTGWTLGTDIRLLLQTWSAVARRRVHL